MTRITMLGTGSGDAVYLYNTCFTIENEKGVFLVDTGGSNEIVKRLREKNFTPTDIKNIFISHSHADHILGFIWMFKEWFNKIPNNTLNEKINVYCNDVVYDTIKGVADYVLQPKLTEHIYNMLNFIILKDNDKYTINGVEYNFFDIKAKGTKQFGFECQLDGKRFIFLGDEPLNKDLYSRIENADYVTHEAFCLDGEADIFKPYNKNHSTALSTAKVMNELNVKNLLLYHTEDSHGDERKKLYTEEAKSIFKGNVLVPNDLEEINL